MRTLTTATGTYLTGDEIADAVLDYWSVLAADHREALVDIPFLDAADQPGRVKLAIGWGLPLSSGTSTSAAVLREPGLIDDLRLRLAEQNAGAPFSDDDFRSQDDAIWAES